MTRETSRQAYHEIKERGLLSNLRFMTYECIWLNGPLTQTECFTKLCQIQAIGKGNGHQSIAPRFAELKRMGVIEEFETRACTVTGNRCISWHVTPNLPIKLEKRLSKTEALKAALEMAEREIANLRAEIAILRKGKPTQFEFTLNP